MTEIDKFMPLADSKSVITIGDLEISNDDWTLNIGGSLKLIPESGDINIARQLAKLFDRAADALEQAMAEGKKPTPQILTGVDQFGLPK